MTALLEPTEAMLNAHNWEVGPCVDRLGHIVSWDINIKPELGARGVAVIASVYSGEETARAILAAVQSTVEHPLARMVRLDEEMGLYDDDETVPSAPQEPDDDATGWLIEDRSNHYGVLYMAMTDSGFGPTKRKSIGTFKFDQYETPLMFVKDANEALRFARQEDAEAFVRVFRRFMLVPEVCEHCWPATRLQAKAPETGEE